MGRVLCTMPPVLEVKQIKGTGIHWYGVSETRSCSDSIAESFVQLAQLKAPAQSKAPAFVPWKSVEGL